jgi:hypothetical protein
MAILVDEDRDRRRGFYPRATRIARGQGLFAVLHAQLGELRQRVQRFVERPVLVHVNLQRRLRRLAHRAHAVDVAAVARTELQLQAQKPVGHSRRSVAHVVGIPEPDRPRRRRAEPAHAEQSPHGDTGQLSLQVVERRVERGPRRPLAGLEPLLDLVQGEGVVAERVGRLFDVLQRGLRCLAVAVDRRTFTEAGDTVVPELYLHHVGSVVRLARDHERLREVQRGDSGRHVHRGYTRRPRACSSGDRACASGAQGRRFDSCQAHSRGKAGSPAASHDAFRGLGCRRTSTGDEFFAASSSVGQTLERRQT